VTGQTVTAPVVAHPDTGQPVAVVHHPDTGHAIAVPVVPVAPAPDKPLDANPQGPMGMASTGSSRVPTPAEVAPAAFNSTGRPKVSGNTSAAPAASAAVPEGPLDASQIHGAPSEAPAAPAQDMTATQTAPAEESVLDKVASFFS
jgi:hypothetical protein